MATELAEVDTCVGLPPTHNGRTVGWADWQLQTCVYMYNSLTCTSATLVLPSPSGALTHHCPRFCPLPR